jgi:hypothetical protein
MTWKMRALFSCCLVLLAFDVAAQGAPAVPLDLGPIPEGEERTFELRGRLNLETASPEQTLAAVQQIAFSIADSSGFCIAIMAPAQRTMLSLTGRESAGSPALFNLSTAPTGIARDNGRRSVLATVAPIAQTTILLDAIVGQTSMAPGDTLTVFVRSYPDRTARNLLDGICGPALR